MNTQRPSLILALALIAGPLAGSTRSASSDSPGSLPGTEMLREYFRLQTTALEKQCLAGIDTLQEWESQRPQLREQLAEMLGLSPWPEKTDLKPAVTGRIERDEFTVEKLSFQSMPGLYVTGNLYLPAPAPARPAPAILYLCGHAVVKTNGISYGNKTGYQHHGAWFARHGYVCLTIDTIQLGEIEGLHHGTYREGMWWWNARGYTPAGVEAWNGIRALDYLQSRPEVDPDKLGVTGRSGGGAYSWWVAALDDRIKAAAPVAGITDLRNHVVDGVVEGHCDCMFVVNTYQWDYPMVAALVAPRPLLICNSDKDSIFPLDGVVRLHRKVANVYQLYNKPEHLGLLITEGPHRDTQDLQLPVFRWFNRHLKGEDPLIETAARKLFNPAELKVFEQLPADERTSRIHETFVPQPETPAVPASISDWTYQKRRWLTALAEKSFRAWPDGPPPVTPKLKFSRLTNELSVSVYEFESQPSVRLPLFLIETKREGLRLPARIRLITLDESDWDHWRPFLGTLLPDDEIGGTAPNQNARPAASLAEITDRLQSSHEALLLFAPRGIGPSAWEGNDRKQVQIRRRFMLLGQTLDGMRVWDIRRAIQAARAVRSDASLVLEGRDTMGVNVLYAALFEPPVDNIELFGIPHSHRQGPDYLNVLRFMDIPQAVAIAASGTSVSLLETDARHWTFPSHLLETLDLPATRLVIAGETPGQ